MYRRIATPNSRTFAGALSALAVAIGTLLITTAPAKADPHFGFFFSAPFPFPVPVVVQHEVVYEEPAPVYYQRPVYYERPVYYQPDYERAYYGHRHHRGCHHGGDYGRRGRAGWDDDDHGEHYYERNVRYRRY